MFYINIIFFWHMRTCVPVQVKEDHCPQLNKDIEIKALKSLYIHIFYIFNTK